ncbi:hypothetical protein KFK09_016494 [Dendrobium nobile]|uniref:Uncharacterized protein n=1 Tax=Dendrobium nobile TaxID=94219 RepID=A0A8T3AYU9_DENNO|nr:hypothetical protein KFK09_016494 [Dendrobium nobile]
MADIESFDYAPFVEYFKALVMSELAILDSLDSSRRAARFDYKLAKIGYYLVT